MPISAGEAQKKFFSLIERVNENSGAIEIVSHRGNTVLISAAEYGSWKETAYLFRSPKNARRLLESYERARSVPRTQLNEEYSADNEGNA